MPSYAVCVKIEEKACEGRWRDFSEIVYTLKGGYPFFIGVIYRDFTGGRDAQLSEQVLLNVQEVCVVQGLYVVEPFNDSCKFPVVKHFVHVDVEKILFFFFQRDVFFF